MEIMGGKLTVFGTNDNTTLCNLVGLNGIALIPPMCMLPTYLDRPISITGPTLHIGVKFIKIHISASMIKHVYKGSTILRYRS